MCAFGVVVDAPFFYDHLCLYEAVEDFTIQTSVPGNSRSAPACAPSPSRAPEGSNNRLFPGGIDTVTHSPAAAERKPTSSTTSGSTVVEFA